MSNKIIFLHSAANSIPEVKGLCSIWNYSDDYVRYISLTKLLPSEWVQGEIGELLDTTAGKLKSRFIDIDDEITTGRFYNSYIASSMGERSPYQNDFFLNLCRALVLKEIASKDGHHIILIDNIELGDSFLKICKTMAIPANWATRTIKSPNSLFLRRCRALYSGFKIALKHWHLGRKYKQSPNSGHHPDALWLMNWAGDTTFNPTQLAKSDTFYGTLATQLEESSPPITWLANPMSWVVPAERISESIHKSTKNVFCVFEFITLKTIFSAIFGWLVFRFSVHHQLSIDGLNLAPIVIYTVRQEQSEPQIILSLLYADIGRLLAKKNLQPKAIIYPFENQPWEKVLVQGFRKQCSSTRLIAMQHTPYADNFVSIIPSSKQWRQNIVPDILVVIGAEFYERLMKYSAPESKLKIGGYYRNPSLTKVSETPPEPKNKDPLILVSCPMNQQESIEMIHKTAIATKGVKNLKIVVNFHPMSGQKLINSIKESAESLIDCGHLKFVNDSAQEWLEICSILIYNSSGTVFDAASLDIPTIYLSPENRLTLDKMPGGSKLKCRTAEALEKNIQQLITNTSLTENVVLHAREALKYSFSQPNAEIWNNVTSLHSFEEQS